MLVAKKFPNYCFSFAVHMSAALVLFLSLWFVGDIIWNGLSGISWSFLIEEPSSAGRAGGIAPMIVSTLCILAICLLVSLPIGLATALLLSEYIKRQEKYGHLIRRSLDVLAGVPSIVFGLFGNAFFAKVLGFGFSILSGGLTLAVMVLPILIRSIEAGLQTVPKEQRLVAASLGLSYWTSIHKLLIPQAMPGIVAGVVLGVGRALAETAALIFTSGYVDRYPESIFDSGRSLSIHIYDLSMNVAGGNANAYKTAFVLLVVILIINQVSSWIDQYYLRKKV